MSVCPKFGAGAAGLLAASLLAILFGLASSGQSNPALDKLYNEHRLLELRALLESVTATTPDVLFYKGYVANAFNRPAESAGYLTSLIQTAGNRLPGTALMDALVVLDDDYS